MIVWEATKRGYGALRERLAAYLANADPLTAAANTGAFIVWSNQPFYPIYVWLLVGRDAWPALLTWLSTPFFFSVPFVGRRSPVAGRIAFALVGLANTLVSVKAFGAQAGIGWFLVPCLVIALALFRLGEWIAAAGLCVGTALAYLAVDHLAAPVLAYSAEQSNSLGRLNAWSAGVLSLYLVYAAIRARRPSA